MKNTLNEVCHHDTVVVDYDHPHGIIENTTIKDLQASPKERTRSQMVLLNPRCKDCGQVLTLQGLAQRVKQGGDLYDERFIFNFG